MAFPDVADTNSSTAGDNSDVTEHPVSLPANIESGNLLLVFFSVDGSPEVTFPANWNKIIDMDANGGAAHLVIAWKKATGSEGSSITVTTDVGERSAHISWRVINHEDPDTQAPEASTGATGSGATPDPDSLLPTGGAKDYLWAAVIGTDDGATDVNSYPTNYDDDQLYCNYASPKSCMVGVCSRSYNASADDPSVFGLDSSEEWAACTIAIYPTGAPPSGKPIFAQYYRQMRI